MKRVCALLLSLLLFLSLWLSMAQAVTYEPVPYIAFSEPYGYRLINVSGPGCAAQIGMHRYLFLQSVPESVRDLIIGKTEAAFAAFELYGAADRPMTIHVVRGDYEPRADGDTLYIGTTSYQSAGYVTGVAELLFGNHVNYGLLCGVSFEVAAQLGEPVDAPASLGEAFAALSGEDRCYLDMNYACFISPYADAAARMHVQTVACAFVSTLTVAEKASFLTNYTDEAFFTRFNVFLAEHGQPAYYNEEIWNFAFHGGGDGSVRLRWDTPRTHYVLDDGFEDFSLAYIEQNGQGSPLNGDYPALRRHVLSFEETLTAAEQLLAPYRAKAPLTIWFENNSVNYTMSYNRLLCAAFYDQASNTIHIGSVSTLGHEYVHAVMAPTGSRLVMEECLAYYVEYVLLPGGLDLIAPAMAENSDPGFLRIAEQTAGRTGRPLDFSNPADYLAVMEAFLYETLIVPGLQDPWQLLSERAFTAAATGTDTAVRLCFFDYLQSVHGFEPCLHAIAANDPSQLGASSWESLVREWVRFVQVKYSSESI